MRLYLAEEMAATRPRSLAAVRLLVFWSLSFRAFYVIHCTIKLTYGAVDHMVYPKLTGRGQRLYNVIPGRAATPIRFRRV
jgi:hypothetical protein